MKATRSISMLLALCAAALVSPLAGAQGLFRTYLQSTGNDANPCTVQAPCRLLPRALVTVADGGEIWMLDSANYNTSTVIIDKSVTILAIPGVTGSVVATGGAQAISIATAGTRVALRNLVIRPLLGASTSGITFTAGDRLSVEKCVIFGLASGAAIHAAGGLKVKVTDSILRNNANGVLVENLSAVDIAATKITGNSLHGVFVNASGSGNTDASISDSIVSDNGVGARAFSGTSGSVGRIFANRATAAGNATNGFASEATGSGTTLVSLGSNLIDKNATGILQSGAGATVRTVGTNYLSDNGNNVIGTLTPLALR